jgi:hypothetical protein
VPECEEGTGGGRGGGLDVTLLGSVSRLLRSCRYPRTHDHVACVCEQVDDFTCSESDPELDPETVIPARGTAGHAGRLPKVRTEHCPRPSVTVLRFSQRTCVFHCHGEVVFAALQAVCVVVGWVECVWIHMLACVAQDGELLCIYGLGGNRLHRAGSPPLPDCTQR